MEEAEPERQEEDWVLEKSTEESGWRSSQQCQRLDSSSREGLPRDGNKECVGDFGRSGEDERFLLVVG